MTTASLKEKPVRDLARLAKQHGVTGWHAMRKDQLIRALVKKAKTKAAAPAATLRPTTSKTKAKGKTTDRSSPTARKTGSAAVKNGRAPTKKNGRQGSSDRTADQGRP